jgi:hypothetical protein
LKERKKMRNKNIGRKNINNETSSKRKRRDGHKEKATRD